VSTVAGLTAVFTGPGLLSLTVLTERSIFNLLHIRELYETLSAHLCMYAVLCVVLPCGGAIYRPKNVVNYVKDSAVQN
jgi:hypothetical protein